MPLIRVGSHAIDTEQIVCVVRCTAHTFIHSKHGQGQNKELQQSNQVVRVLLKGDLGEIQFAGADAAAFVEFVARLPEWGDDVKTAETEG